MGSRMESSAQDFKQAPAPWHCSAQIYAMYFVAKAEGGSAKKDLEAVAYSPLERASYFASAEAGTLVGGLASLMLVRYADTPVGPYDELIICPGSYLYQAEEKGALVERKNLRISRIYVSQRDSAYNGRRNWNTPKHLARFHWEDLPDGTTRVQVYPHDTGPDEAETEAEAEPSPAPLFRASFRTVPLVPSFPLSTSWARHLPGGGPDLSLAQPPLPRGAAPEAAGTDRWCRFLAAQSSPRAHLGWFDVRQRDGEARGRPPAGPPGGGALFENFLPGLGRWHLGVRMDDATIHVPEGQHWPTPRRIS